ncbi:hypothetical protein KAR91_68960 [Candidatus Pacearchaeota archaeon]|nr:hypothetical protein [Candidatus Pacearchaeota archaeon]
MGAWGYGSCDNDHVHNALDLFCEKSSHMGQRQASQCLESLWNVASKCRNQKRYNTIKHGVVMFILSSRGLKVPIDKLEEVLAIAKHRIKKGVIRYEGWKDQSRRNSNVAFELTEIGEAIKRGGQGRKRLNIGNLISNER